MTTTLNMMFTKAKTQPNTTLQPEYMTLIRETLYPEVCTTVDYALNRTKAVTNLTIHEHDITVVFDTATAILPLVINFELRPVMARPLVITMNGKNTKVSRVDGLKTNVLHGVSQHIEQNRDRLKHEALERIIMNRDHEREFIAKIKRSNTSELIKLITSSDVHQRALIAQYSNDSVRMLLITDTSYQVREAIAEFGSPALRSLLINDDSSFVLQKIARFGNDSQREILLRSNDEFVRAELAHFGSERIQWFLIHDMSADVRANIVMYGTDEHRTQLKADANDVVRTAFNDFQKK